jgi:hypothetical protein
MIIIVIVIIIIISSVQQYRWRCVSPWRWLEEINHCTVDKDPVLSLIITSQQVSNPIVTCPVLLAACLSHSAQTSWCQFR